MSYSKEWSFSDLSRIFCERAWAKEDAVHVAIDLQWEYAEDYPEVAKHITRHIAPAFRKMAIPNYWVCTDNNDGPKYPMSAFYKFRPRPNERKIKKNAISAFVGSDIERCLQEDHKKLLIVSGLYADACVGQTVKDALKKYDVIVMHDATDTHPRAFDFMADKGAIITSSKSVLSVLSTLPLKKLLPAAGSLPVPS